MRQIYLRPDFYYYTYGDNPELIIHSGTHGDEFSTIPLIEEWVKNNFTKLPAFVFVPHVSPSALLLHTRFNADGQDLNRIFIDDSQSVEVIINQQILRDIRADVIVSFHEDTQLPQFYLYDDGPHPFNPEKLESLFGSVADLGVSLLNGVDDPSDPTLCHEFTDGYRFFDTSKSEHDNSTVTGWCIDRGIAKQALVPEIPTSAALETKSKLVATIFESLFDIHHRI